MCSKFSRLVFLLLSFIVSMQYVEAKLRHDNLPFVGAQVFIEPGQSDRQIDKWFRTLSEHGFSMCRIRMFESYMTNEGNWDFSLFDKAFDAAHKYNIKVYATLFPATLKTDIGGWKLPYDRQQKESFARFIKNVVGHYSSHPALFGWVLINEPGEASLPDSPYIREQFDAWSKEHPEADFSDDGYPVLVSNMRHRFHADMNTQFLNWVAEQVKLYDNQHDVHVNSHAIFNNCAQYDFPAWRKFLTSLGGSAHAAWHFGYFPRQDYALAVLANAEIIRSGSGSLPWMMTELQGGNNTFSGVNALCPTPQEIEQWLYLVCCCEGKGSIFWMLNPRKAGVEAGEWAMLDFNDEPTQRLKAASGVSAVINQNKNIMSDIKVKESGIDIVYVRESMWADEMMASKNDRYEGRQPGSPMKAALACFKALSYRGLNVGFKELREYDFSKADYRGKSIILANQISFPASHKADLEHFVRCGGTLLIEGLSLFFNEEIQSVMDSGFPYKNLTGYCLSEYILQEELFDMDFEAHNLDVHLWKGVFPDSNRSMTTNSFGKGKVIWIPSSVAMGARVSGNYKPLSDFLFEMLPHGEDVECFTEYQDGVIMRTANTPDGTLLLCINNSGHDKNIKIMGLDAEAKILYNSKDGKITRQNIKIADNATILALISGQPDLKTLIGRGDIVRGSYNEDAPVGCYLANGRFGAVFSASGLNERPEDNSPDDCQSVFSYMQHWGRFSFTSAIEEHRTTADYLLPFFRLYWDEPLKNITSYSQHHSMYDGTLCTSFQEDGADVSLCNWFDQVDKDVFGMKVNLSKGTRTIRLSVPDDFIAYGFVFRDKVHQSVSMESVDGDTVVSVCCEQALNRKQNKLYIYTNAEIESDERGLSITLSEGESEIFISYGHPIDAKSRRQSLERTRKVWNEKWSETAWFDFPDENAQKLWVRSTSYILSTHDDFEYGMIQPTNGLTGNVFPFHFVQDLGYISPALQMMGRNDIVMRWIEKFAGEIDDMKAYAKHLWPTSEGIYPPWELPFGSIEGYHQPNVPVAFCYEPHNPAYLCRMAAEAAAFSGDDKWARTYAYPLIEEIAAFYKSACTKGSDGLWHLKWYPCVGQDEAGGRNRSDYLCSLYSAMYSFKTLVGLGLDKDGSVAAILSDGLAFSTLVSDRGTLHTAHGTENDFGHQKHPVQLDGLSYLPIEDAPLSYERKAYELRYDITSDARKPFFHGWTLGQLLLSASNLADTDGWQSDWSLLRKSNYTDPEWIQLYETSGKHSAAFYVTTHGMILQSIIRNYVNDYWGRLQVGACPVFDGTVKFGNVSTRLGVKVSGSVNSNGSASYKLKAYKNCSLDTDNMQIHLKKGKTKIINL